MSSGSSRVILPIFPPRNSSSIILAALRQSASPPFLMKPLARAIFSSISAGSSMVSNSALYLFLMLSGSTAIIKLMNSVQSVCVSKMSSFMEPIIANFSPTSSSSNLGQSMPGVSRSSKSFFSLIHCFPLVTPGLSPVLAVAFPTLLFMNVDFPTFGMPTIMALTGTKSLPLAFSLSIFSFISSEAAADTLLTPVPFTASDMITVKPFSSKYFFHISVFAGSARSLLFITIILFLFFASESMSGFLLLYGILASISSTTTSTREMFSSIILLVFVICPGYHCIFIIHLKIRRFFTV